MNKKNHIMKEQINKQKVECDVETSKGNQKSKKKDIYPIIFCIILISFFIIIGIYFIYSVVTSYQNLKETINSNSEVTTTTTILKSVNYQSEIDSKFILGTGSINEKNYYIAYEVLEDGGLKLKKIQSDLTIIYETLEKDTQAYLETDENGWGSTIEMRLYLPQNTIQQSYTINLDDN